MMLDDVFGAELDQFPLEQDASDWDAIELEWDDEEAVIAAQFSKQLTDR